MRVALLFICLIFIPYTAFAQSDGGAQEDFDKSRSHMRSFMWGVGAEDIRIYEPDDFFGEHDGTLTFRGFHEGLPAYVAYYFLNDRFWKLRVDFNAEYSRGKQAIDDYLDIRARLEQRHGEYSESLTWFDESLKSDPEYWGLAVIQGMLQFESVWVIDDSLVRLVLGGKDFEAKLQTTYVSRKIAAEQQRLELVPNSN